MPEPLSNSPKISCLPVSLFADIQSGKISIKDWACFAKEIGLDAMDIGIILLKNHTPVHLQQVAKDLADAQMSICMATTYPDFTHPDLLQRKREMDYLRHDIALCSQLRIPYLRVTAGQAHSSISRADGIRWAVANLREAAPLAEAYGVRLVFEDHSKPGAWQSLDFAYAPENFLEIARQVEPAGVKVNFDTGNIVAYGEDPLPVLEAVIGQVATIHVSDMAEKGVFRPTAIGAGVVPNREIFAYLKRAGFTGWLCIEEASGTGFEGIRKAVEYVRNIWNEV